MTDLRAQVELRPPETPKELWHFVRAVFGVTIPAVAVCDDHQAPFEAFADAYFARHPIAIWKASRGLGGKSWLLATLANTMAVGLNAQTTILGGSGAQSLNVHLASQAAWAYPHAPKHLIAGEPTKYDTHLATGAWIRSLMASQTSVRGPHPQRLLMDEIDEMDLEILEAAQGQPMRGRHGLQKGIETGTVLSSTHQYPNGTMSAMLERADQNGWPVFHWCYRESSNPVDGWLEADEVERKKGEIAARMWETEYELQEPSFEGRAIDEAALERTFDKELGYTDDFTWFAPKTTKIDRCVTGVDWAKERDRTVITTFNVNPTSGQWECVAFSAMNRAPWPAMVAAAEERLASYPDGFAHDATGLGNVISDYFNSDLRRRYSRTFKDVVMSGGRSRMNLFSDYISAIENDLIRMPRISLAYSEHKYMTWDDLFGSGHPPDTVVAGAIAWTLRPQVTRPKPAMPVSFTREPGNWKAT